MLAKNRIKSQRGFTLIELMIVVALIGILATIAMINIQIYQLKSKTSEAKSNLGALRLVEEIYLSEHDKYLPCLSNPPTIPGSSRLDWGSPVDFTRLGFSPVEGVYYQYAVSVTAALIGSPANFSATATGDLDANATNAVYSTTRFGTIFGPAPADAH